jgi:hypothetical protein
MHQLTKKVLPMNPIITRELLENAGINLDGKDVDALIDHLNQTLEERVGAEITNSLSDEQLKEMLDLQENGSDEQLFDWMNLNVPEMDEMVHDEVDIIIGELAEESDSLNEAA